MNFSALCHTLINAHLPTLHNDDSLSVSAFEQAGVDMSKPSVVMCGGAVVAPFVAFAASLIGFELPVYDVSLLE